MTNHTTYSFGIDDQEFIPAFEAEEPADFMHLMMTLRETEASRWTERDTPIFVGKLVDVRVALDALDGAVTELPSAETLYTAPGRHAVSLRARPAERARRPTISPDSRALRRASTRRRRRTGRTR